MRVLPFVLLCAVGAALLPASAALAQTSAEDPAQQYRWIYSLRIDDQAFRSIGGSSGGLTNSPWSVLDFDKVLRKRIKVLSERSEGQRLEEVFAGEPIEVRLLALLLSLSKFSGPLKDNQIKLLSVLDPKGPEVSVKRETLVEGRDRLKAILYGTGKEGIRKLLRKIAQNIRQPEYFKRHVSQGEAELYPEKAGSATHRALREGTFLALLEQHVEGGLPGPNDGADHHAIGGNVPPLSSLSVAVHAQTDGSYSVSVPETVFSYGPASTELGLAPFVAGTQGYTVFGRVDLSPANFPVVQATANLRDAAKRSDAEAGDTPEKIAFYRDSYLLHLYGIPAVGPGFADAFDRAAEAPRFLIDAAYSRIEDTELFEGGGTFSKLFRLECLNDDSPGLRVSAGAHGLWQREAAIALPLLGISFQDRIQNIQLPDELEEVYDDPKHQPDYRRMGLIRWNYQVGFNYLFGTEGSGGDRQEVFFRYRLQPKKRHMSLADWYAKITDLTFSVSRTSRDDVIFEVKVAKAFGL